MGITDSAGTTAFTYDAGDEVTGITATAPLGNTVTKEYDQQGNLTKTIDAKGLYYMRAGTIIYTK